MSGLEIAGLVLAALPLLFSALGHVKAKKGVVASFIEWHDQLQTLIRELDAQQTIFYIDMLNLLRSARVDDDIDWSGLSMEKCVDILRNARNEAKVERYLGFASGSFLNVLGGYEQCLKEIYAGLRNIIRPDNADDNDLRALLASLPKNGSITFKKRVNFTIGRTRLKQLIADLRNNQSLLKEIIEGTGKVQQQFTVGELSREAEKLAGVFRQVQINAKPLFAAICEVCTCSCRSGHKVLMRLDSRVALQKKPKHGHKPEEHTIFRLVLALEDSLQETFVKTPEPEETGDESFVASNQDEVTGIPAAAIPTIIVSHVPRENNNNPGNQTQVTDICHHACRARSSGHILRLQLTKSGLQLLGGSPEPRRELSAPKTLENFLRDGDRNIKVRMSPRQRVYLALDIAASILQLQQTCWFNFPFNNKGIKFLVHRPPNLTTAVLEPFVERAIEDDWSKWQNVPGEPEPRTVLIELAILLLEIWHHKPLEVWAATMEGENVESDEGRMMAAVRWFQLTREYIPPHHQTAIEKCLVVRKVCFWDDNEFLKEYCEDIIKPLLESYRTWS